ncbi:MAG: enoyl-CoA hydratase/isomerase family protein [Gammaproteobacteria bacterium]|nr:MAG: enoyl-CoA hydratase/isomerase family protein [Gammaproteobacteria bacterium]
MEKLFIEERRDNGVVVLTLNRPEVHNAFNDELIAALIEGLQALNSDPSVRVVQLRGAGKSFSAGADLNWMQRMAQYSWEENYQDSLKLASLMSTLANMSMPTMAVVQGAAFGGGVGLVAACDFALASDRASFCLSEVKLGLIPAVISPYVVRAIGARAARRYFVTAERFDADTALRTGLVQEVVPHDTLTQRADEVCDAIANNGPLAVREAKKLVSLVAESPIDEEIIRETANRIADRRASPEGMEGIRAFLEKRPPVWPPVDKLSLKLFDDDGEEVLDDQ